MAASLPEDRPRSLGAYAVSRAFLVLENGSSAAHGSGQGTIGKKDEESHGQEKQRNAFRPNGVARRGRARLDVRRHRPRLSGGKISNH